MTDFIRSVDGAAEDTTRHLIGTVSEGLMNDGSGLFPLDNGRFDGVDLPSQHALAKVDYITIHTFPNPNHNFGDGPGPEGDSLFWDGEERPGESQATTGFAGPFDLDAVAAVLDTTSALARALGKPLLIEEYGIHPFTDPFGLTGNTRDDVYQRINDAIVDSFQQTGPIAGGWSGNLYTMTFPRAVTMALSLTTSRAASGRQRMSSGRLPTGLLRPKTRSTEEEDNRCRCSL